MIEQAYVQASDETTPAIKALRDLITQAVEATEGTAFAPLTFWLQMPASPEFKKMMDNDCQVRASRVASALSLETGGSYLPADLSVALGVPAKWAALDKAVSAGRVAIINGSTSHVGGSASKFNNERNTGFHVIVFLAVGKESTGRRFYLGFDPDVSSTAESQAKWKLLVTGDTAETAKTFDGKQSKQVVKAMILGDSETGFGPLVRKYYVDTDKAFPKIIRG
ncbi:hypothetical protein ABZ721_31930 [Streptomyces sp. NPDC006733]|uniref:hypothetical protein n=1 Tax=Streptomyces sp. NPDC006733 TaxID=3155460 RepID=UPI0033EF4A23